MVQVVRCQELIERVPTDIYGVVRDDHAFQSRCGRPVVRDGLCAVHLRRTKPKGWWPKLRDVIGWN